MEIQKINMTFATPRIRHMRKTSTKENRPYRTRVYFYINKIRVHIHGV